MGNISTPHVVVALICIVIIGAGLRYHGIDREPLWMDEAATLRYADLPLAQLWGKALDTNPPLYYTLQKAWLVFGRSEAALRSLSALIGTISIILSYGLGKVIAGTGSGLLGALLLATSALHVEYSQEARGYVLLVAASTLALWGLAQIISECEHDTIGRPGSSITANPSRTRSVWMPWSAYGIGCIVALYTHNTAVLLLILSNCVLCGWWAAQLRCSRHFLPRWLVVNLIILGAWSWWLPVVIRQTGGELTGFWLVRPSVLGAIETVANLYGQIYVWHWQPYATLTFIAFGLAGLLALSKRVRWVAILLTVIFVFLPITTYLISFGSPIFMLRTILWPLPAFLTSVAVGIALSPIRAFALILVVTVMGLQSAALANYYSFGVKDEPWNDLVHVIQSEQLSSNSDAILLCAADSEIPFNYYATRSHFLAPLRGIVTSHEPAWRQNLIRKPVGHALTIEPDQIRQFVAPFARVWLIERLCESSAAILGEMNYDYKIVEWHSLGGLKLLHFRRK